MVSGSLKHRRFRMPIQKLNEPFVVLKDSHNDFYNCIGIRVFANPVYMFDC
jgi:hypothetical protein